MRVSWNRYGSVPTGTGSVVKTFFRDRVELAEIDVDLERSDPEWTTFPYETVILPFEVCKRRQS